MDESGRALVRRTHHQVAQGAAPTTALPTSSVRSTVGSPTGTSIRAPSSGTRPLTRYSTTPPAISTALPRASQVATESSVFFVSGGAAGPAGAVLLGDEQGIEVGYAEHALQASPQLRGGVCPAADQPGEVARGDSYLAGQLVLGDVLLLEKRPHRRRVEPDPQRAERVFRFASTHPALPVLTVSSGQGREEDGREGVDEQRHGAAGEPPARRRVRGRVPAAQCVSPRGSQAARPEAAWCRGGGSSTLPLTNLPTPTCAVNAPLAARKTQGRVYRQVTAACVC